MLFCEIGWGDSFLRLGVPPCGLLHTRRPALEGSDYGQILLVALLSDAIAQRSIAGDALASVFGWPLGLARNQYTGGVLCRFSLLGMISSSGLCMAAWSIADLIVTLVYCRLMGFLPHRSLASSRSCGRRACSSSCTTLDFELLRLAVCESGISF